MQTPLEQLRQLVQTLKTIPRAPSGQRVIEVAQWLSSLPPRRDNSASSQSEWCSELEQCMVASATLEPVWGLLAGTRLWAAGWQRPGDFHNVWECARYAGIQSRFSAHSPAQHLAWAKTFATAGNPNGWTDPAPFIIQGNALRQLSRFAEAESAYLKGLEHCPDNPFLRFRLVDLWLMTYQHQRAAQMLGQLRARYPYALEQMFALPIPDAWDFVENLATVLTTEQGGMVWLVSADTKYIQRYGVRMAQGLATVLNTPGAQRIKLHLHIVAEPSAELPMRELATIAAMVPTQVTKRTINLESATTNQRRAVFASERFLVLPELLTKYDCPLLVTDIDVEVLQHPGELFELMGDGDIGHTRFGIVREAWDLYPATALCFKPTAAARQFCTRLAGMITTLLNTHPEPWFVDQIALFRIIEDGMTPAKLSHLEHILTDAGSPQAFFRLLHGSWQE